MSYADTSQYQRGTMMMGSVAGTPVWTEETVQSLGMTTDIETAAQILGIGRTTAYALAKAGTFPARVIRVGRCYKVSVPALLILLAAGPPDPTPHAATP
jgi:hypothetical protein